MTQMVSASMVPANQPNLRSFIEVSPDSHFPIQNLPYGIFSVNGDTARVGVAIGDFVLDVTALAERGLLGSHARDGGYFAQESLNSFMGQGRAVWSTTRARLSELLRADYPTLRDDPQLRKEVLFPRGEVTLHLPIRVAGYTDFYSSIDHARNVGAIMRGAENALPANWKHLPIAYDARAGSVVVSGTPVRRPWGQVRPDDKQGPMIRPCQALDFELEMAFVVGVGSSLGQPVPCDKVDEYVFGVVLLNDWSARDIQKWEYQPLGPFLGKNFATSISPWIVPLEALEPFKVPAQPQEPEPLEYLRSPRMVFDISLEVAIQPGGATEAEKAVVTRSNTKHLYWDHYQQLAHHTVNGCSLQSGDLYATGTISGPTDESKACLLELNEGGRKPISLGSGRQSVYLQDGDTVTMTGAAEWNERGIRYRVGFGDVSGLVLPAVERPW